jgi:hypothetical protein
MTGTNANDERPVVHFTRGPHRFEVYRSRSERGVSYVGYFDGRPSVTTSERHVIARMLLRKYMPHALNQNADRLPPQSSIA